MTHWQVVDLGTKRAGALNVFVKHHRMYFDNSGIVRSRCLGVDRAETSYRDEVEAQGYVFEAADVLKSFTWPKADYYLAFDFLEHMPSVEVAQGVLSRMLDCSAKGVWLRMPSFEPEACEQLRALGVRFNWTTWPFHPAHLQCRHVEETVKKHAGWGCRFKAARKIAHTNDRCIVPASASSDAADYNSGMGPKPLVALSPPIPGQWEAILRRGS